MNHSRRSFLRALVGSAPATPALLASLDAAVSRAAAQAAPGSRVPPIQFAFPNWPDYVEISRLVSRTWSQLGVGVELRQGTTESVMAEVIGAHRVPHAVGVSWGGAPDRLDPDYFLTEFFHSRRATPGGLNYGHFRNAEFDTLADAQRAEMDEGRRRELVQRAQRLLAAENPALVLLFRNTTQAYNRRRFDGIVETFGSGIGQSYIPWTYYRMRPLTNRRIVRVVNFTEIVTLNPFATPEIFNATLLRWMYPTFVTRAPDGRLEPWTASSWNVVDPTTVDITLREGLRFDDGRPVTVEDVKFTFDYMLRWRFPAMARVHDTVESVEIRSPREVRFKLKQPSAAFVPSVLGFTFVAPRHVWEAVPGTSGLRSPADWPNDRPVGYGGFRFREWRRGEFIQFDANKEFFTPPSIDGVIWLVVPNMENQLAMMESGAADIVGWTLDAEQARRLDRHPDLRSVTVPSHGMHEIRLNMEMAPITDPRFRLALQHATNRAEIAEVVFGGLAAPAANSMISPSSPWAAPDVPNVPFSIEAGRRVLAEAGYTWDAEGRLLFPRA